MFYLIYKITNTINNKIYVGSHKTKNKDDGYMGSGKYLRYSISKHGVENFTKEILFEFDNPGDMYAKEAEIVNDAFLAEENTYNLKRGGFGGFDYINNTMDPEKRKEISRKGAAGRHNITVEQMQEWGRKGAAISRSSESQKMQYATGRKSGFLNKTHTDATKHAIGQAAKVKQAGERNSQYGTRWAWINKDSEVKKVRLDLLNNFINDGWHRGMK